MDREAAVTPPLELPTQGARDQLVLARLHQQPLAFLHLEAPPGAETRERLAAAAWRTGRTGIVSHARSHGCLPVPRNADELSALLLAANDAACPRMTARRPAGKATVIVCTLGLELGTLARSLQSLAQMRCENFELLVVDNLPSRTETRELVESFVARVRIRYVPEPRPGLARARNTGVAAAGDSVYVAFTDDDVAVDPSWLSWLLDGFTESAVEAVTGLVMPLGLESVAQKRFERYAGFGKGVRRQIYDLDQHAARDRFLYPYWGGMFGSGNSMAFRRQALLALGGFDAALGAGTATAGGEDLAAFSDVILAGGQIVYEPRALCWHEHRSDEAALRAQVRNYGIGLTAVLWRYLMTDWRFSATLVRSLPAITRLVRRRSADRGSNRLPADLARIEQRGRLLGPWRYMVSSRRAHSRSGADAARRRLGERHRAANQAGAQTRT